MRFLLGRLAQTVPLLLLLSLFVFVLFSLIPGDFVTELELNPALPQERVAELRESLEPDDQTLLILRVNRALSWKDVAMVLEAIPPDDEAGLDRGAARVRQRFQAIKKRVRELAKRHGLLESPENRP